MVWRVSNSELIGLESLLKMYGMSKREMYKERFLVNDYLKIGEDFFEYVRDIDKAFIRIGHTTYESRLDGDGYLFYENKDGGRGYIRIDGDQHFVRGHPPKQGALPLFYLEKQGNDFSIFFMSSLRYVKDGRSLMIKL